MDQQSIWLFLAMKRLSAQAIYNELVAVLGPDAIGYSTITNYLRQRHFPSALRGPPTNQQQPLLTIQFWMASKSSHFLLSVSWPSSPAFRDPRSIDTKLNHLGL
jgi:hypothetical protein